MKQTLITLLILVASLSCSSPREHPILVDWEEKKNLFSLHRDNDEYDKALSTAKELVQDAERYYPDDYRLAHSYHLAGLAYSDLHNFGKAEEYFNESLSIEKALDISSADNYYELSVVYESTDREDLALDVIKKALNAYSSITHLDSTSISRSKLRMVSILTTKQEYDQAYALLNESVEYANATGDESLIMDNALSYVELSLHLNMFEQAQKVNDEVLDYHKRNTNHYAYSSALNMQGAIYYRMEKFEKALDYFNLSAEHQLRYYKDSTLIDMQLKNIAKTYEVSGDSVHAQRYYRLFDSVKK